jgi:hypothetical protein
MSIDTSYADNYAQPDFSSISTNTLHADDDDFHDYSPDEHFLVSLIALPIIGTVATCSKIAHWYHAKKTQSKNGTFLAEEWCQESLPLHVTSYLFMDTLFDKTDLYRLKHEKKRLRECKELAASARAAKILAAGLVPFAGLFFMDIVWNITKRDYRRRTLVLEEHEAALQYHIDKIKRLIKAERELMEEEGSSLLLS